MFQDYSQTYASTITTVVGFTVLIAHQLGYNFVPADIEFLIGVILNFGGALWTLIHRYSKGDVTLGGARK